MARMTDEEADYWDEHYTRNPPSPGPNGTGFFTRRKAEREQSCLQQCVTLPTIIVDEVFSPDKN
jgi:hypothetical protein